MRDITLEDTVYKTFTTRQFSTGAPFTLAGTPVVSAYENDGTTEITAGITLTVDFDGKTGLNLLTIAATAANGFEAGKDYNFVITTGTVDSVSVVGETVWGFSIGRSAAAVDLANATDGLTALKALIDALPTAASAADAVWDEARAGHVGAGSFGQGVASVQGDVTGNVDGSVASVTGAVGSVTGAVGSVTGNVGGNVVGSTASVTGAVGSVTGAVGSVAGNVDGNVTGSVGSLVGHTNQTADHTAAIAALPTAAGNADAVWDEAIADHLGVGSTGAALNAAGAAGDPWITPLPGAYGAGTAGKIVGDNVDAAISATATAAALATAQTDLDTLTGADGVTLATAQGLYAPSKAGDAMALTAGERNTVADSVWDEAIAGHLGAGSTGAALNGASAPTAAAVADAVWDEARAGHVAGGSFGEGAASVQGNVTGSVASVTGAVGSVTGAVGSLTTNNDKTGYTLTSADHTLIADELLKRDWNSVSGEASRSCLNAFRFLRNKWSIAGGTLTVTEEDDATSAWTSALSTDAAADPVIASDPV